MVPDLRELPRVRRVSGAAGGGERSTASPDWLADRACIPRHRRLAWRGSGPEACVVDRRAPHTHYPLSFDRDGLAGHDAARDRATRLLVVAPLSIFFGWCGVATFANATAVLRQTHVTAPGPVESWISAAMLVVATAIAVKATRVLQGNRWYAGTILWALVAIAVADLLGWRRPPNVAVATVALAGVGTVGATVRAMPPDPTSKQARTLVNHQS